LRPVVLSVVLLVAASVAGAETYVVTTDADSGPGSLREALDLAEFNGESDHIVFADDYTIMLETPLRSFATEVAILGNGLGRTIIDCTNVPPGVLWGALKVRWDGDVVLDALTVRNSPAKAIDAAGSLLVTNSRFENNSSLTSGGAMGLTDTRSDVTVRSSVFVGNHADGPGGAISVLSGNLDVEGCTFEDNDSDGPNLAGGAVGVVGGMPYVRIANSTFSRNNAQDWGGAFYFYGSASADLINITITENTATVKGDGIYVDGPTGPIRISHSIIDDACAFYLSGAITSEGHNLESGDTCSLDPELGDMINTDPVLGPLVGHGGPTPTHALLPGSPAIDGGELKCELPVDQRGFPRPVDGDDDGTLACDIGAYELQGVIFSDGFESGDTAAWSAATGG
jgi:hypothetical protein